MMKRSLLIIAFCFFQLVGFAQVICYPVKGNYISTESGETTYHKISKKYFIGYSMKGTFYYKNKITWKSDCHFRSEHFINNSNWPIFRPGTGYECQTIEATDDHFTFSFKGDITGSSGVLTYKRIDGPIPKNYRRIRKLKHSTT